MVLNLEIGMVTPPIGLNLFVTAGITKMSIMQVARAALPWPAENAIRQLRVKMASKTHH